MTIKTNLPYCLTISPKQSPIVGELLGEYGDNTTPEEQKHPLLFIGWKFDPHAKEVPVGELYGNLLVKKGIFWTKEIVFLVTEGDEDIYFTGSLSALKTLKKDWRLTIPIQRNVTVTDVV